MRLQLRDDGYSFHIVFGDLNDGAVFGGGWKAEEGEMHVDKFGSKKLKSLKKEADLFVNVTAHVIELRLFKSLINLVSPASPSAASIPIRSVVSYPEGESRRSW